MSQRVQKGSTLFKPVARPRPGGEPRSVSTVPDPPSVRTGTNGESGTRASSTMPPPATVPSRQPTIALTSMDVGGAPDGTVGIHSLDTPEQDIPQQASASVGVPRVPPSIPVPIAPGRGPPRIASSGTHSRNQIVPIIAPSRVPPSIGASQVAASAIQPPSKASATQPPEMRSLTATEFSDIASQISAGTVDLSHIDPQLFDSAIFTETLTNALALSMSDSPLNGAPSTASVLPSSGRYQSPRIYQPAAGQGDAETHMQSDDMPGPSRKRRRGRSEVDTEDDENEEPVPKRQPRARSTRHSRRKAPSPPPFDPNADPGEEIDPTSVTMADLCADTGQGRVSSKAAQIINNHAAWRAASREKRAQMRAAAEAKKYGRSEEETRPPDKSSGTPNGTTPSGQPASTAPPPAIVASTSQGDTEQIGEDDFDYNSNVSLSRYNVQVRIGANGETIIDDASLFVDRDESYQTEDYTHVEESDFTKFVNSATYTKKLRGSRWSAEETELFYDALSQFGENYELISYVLPGRDRKACRNKFKSEDKRNSARITYCLNNRKPYDIETLSRLTGKDFSGPTPEIRAPTPLLSSELEMLQPEAIEKPLDRPSSPRTVRKKSKTPSARDAGVEIMGTIDDIDKDDGEPSVSYVSQLLGT